MITVYVYCSFITINTKSCCKFSLAYVIIIICINFIKDLRDFVCIHVSKGIVNECCEFSLTELIFVRIITLSSIFFKDSIYFFTNFIRHHKVYEIIFKDFTIESHSFFLFFTTIIFSLS